MLIKVEQGEGVFKLRNIFYEDAYVELMPQR